MTKYFFKGVFFLLYVESENNKMEWGWGGGSGWIEYKEGGGYLGMYCTYVV